MDIEKISDLELANFLSKEQEILSQALNNVNLLKAELKKRLEKEKEVADTVAAAASKTE